jgi:hypothetical protein
MTPKEKAKQLYELIRYDVSTLKGTEALINEVAKRCALITVDEILKQFEKIKVSHIINGYITYKDFEENLTSIQNQLDSQMISKWSYWNEVKHEIETI